MGFKGEYPNKSFSDARVTISSVLQKTMYKIELSTNRTGKCVKQELNEPFRRFEIPANATALGAATIGSNAGPGLGVNVAVFAGEMAGGKYLSLWGGGGGGGEGGWGWDVGRVGEWGKQSLIISPSYNEHCDDQITDADVYVTKVNTRIPHHAHAFRYPTINGVPLSSESGMTINYAHKLSPSSIILHQAITIGGFYCRHVGVQNKRKRSGDKSHCSFTPTWLP